MELLTKYYGFDWLAVTLGLIAVYKIGDKKRFGFIFYMLAALAGFIFAILAHSVAYIVINTLMFFMQFRAFIKWGKNI